MKKAPKEKTPVQSKSTSVRSPSKSRSASRSQSSQPSQPSQQSQQSQRSQLALSEGDLSSDSEAEHIVQQKREAGEMTDRIRTSMLQYFGGRKNHTRWVMKCTSRVPQPPPPRSIKKIAIAAYENRSIDFYFALLAK